MHDRRFLAPVLVSSLLCAALLRAQEAPPSPSAEQELLARAAGTWDCVATFFDGDKPIGKFKLREATERVCGGLFLLTRSRGVDLPMERCTLFGWDARKSRICGVETDSMGPTPSDIDGSVDLKTGAVCWTLTAVTEQGKGQMLTEVRFEGSDTRIERLYAQMPDGKKALQAEIRGTRAKDDAAPDGKPAPRANPAIEKALEAGAKLAANSKPHARLAQFAGEWTVATEMAIEGAPAMKGAMESKEQLVCNGRFVLTRVDGEFASMPFHAVGLMGFDPVKNRYVSYWADSFGPFMAQSEGECDDEGTTFTMRGGSVGMDGSATTMDDTTTFADKDARKTVMVNKRADGKVDSTMTVECARKKATEPGK